MPPVFEAQNAWRNYQGVIQPKGFEPLPAGWISEWQTLNAKGLQLFSAIHRAGTWKTGRVLVVVHGLFEHGGRYLHFPHHLQGAVDAVCCLDLRGHGRSEGLRGHVEEFDQLTDDVILYIRYVEEFLQKFSSRHEIHLFGHSLGGLLAVRALNRDRTLPVKAAAIASPLLGIKVDVPVAKKVAAFLLAKTWGSVHLLSELNAEQLSHDKDVGLAYRADRLVHQKMTPRFYAELQAALKDTDRSKVHFTTPLQVLVPLEDQIVDTQAVLKFYGKLNTRDRELKTYAGYFHELFNEIGKEKPFEDLRAWILSHSAIS